MDLQIRLRYLQDKLEEALTELQGSLDAYEAENRNDHDILSTLSLLQPQLDDGIRKLKEINDIDEQRFHIIKFLNTLLKVEYNKIFEYNYYADALENAALADKLRVFGAIEREHARILGEYIEKLGGEPRFNPPELHTRRTFTLEEMLQEHLRGEERAIVLLDEGLSIYNDGELQWVLGNIRKDELEHKRMLLQIISELENPAQTVRVAVAKWAADEHISDEDRPWVE